MSAFWYIWTMTWGIVNTMWAWYDLHHGHQYLAFFSAIMAGFMFGMVALQVIEDYHSA